MEFNITRDNEEGRHGLICFKSSDAKIHKEGALTLHPCSHDHGPNVKKTLETPGFILYTRYGRIPNLTKDVAEYIPRLPNFRRMRLSELMEESVRTGLKPPQKNYQDFTSNDEATFFCSVQDIVTFNKPDIHKYAEDKTVSVWTQSGRKKVSAEEFMNAVALAGIRCVEALCDILPSGESCKRCRKSVDRTLRYLDKCIGIKNDNMSKYGDVSLFGAIVGGDNIKERLRSANETAKRSVEGFILEGFDQLGDNWLEILNLTIAELPKDKPRILFGIFKPDQIISAIGCGVDIVDSSYVSDISERGFAAVFEYRCKRHKHSQSETYDEVADSSNPVLEFEIDLKDSRYKEDFRPILQNCSCYTCLNYTRVYLNHLLTTNEMLAQVLLTIHNLHHFIGFMSAIRSALQNGSLKQLKTDLLKTKNS